MNSLQIAIIATVLCRSGGIGRHAGFKILCTDCINFEVIEKDNASVVELVDTLDSKSGFFGSDGSSPSTGTIIPYF
jgi:hypothetical protein